MLPFGSPHFTVTEYYDTTTTIPLRNTMGPPLYSQRNLRQRLNDGSYHVPTPEASSGWPPNEPDPPGWQAPSSQWDVADHTPWPTDPTPWDDLPVELPAPIELPGEDDAPEIQEDDPMTLESGDAPGTPDSM